MKISDLVKSLQETKQSFGDLQVKIDAGMSACLGKRQYVIPGIAIRNFTDEDGKSQKTLVLW